MTRDADLRRKYGITAADYDRMLAAQGGVCAICGRPPKTRRLNVDHDHNTGRIRGILCWRCNKGLQFFSDDAKHLRRAAAYVKRTR
jgi:hypothetical protein